MEIHVCDIADSKLLGNVQTLENQGKKHIIKMHPMSNGITHMVDKIKELAEPQSIDRLVFWGHGSNGAQGLSRGAESDRDEDWAGITVENFTEARPILVQLDEYFKRTAVAELRGCSVGNSVRGQWLLTYLADLWAVKVRAGAVTQYGPHWGWVGPVHEAKPGFMGTNVFNGQVRL